MSRRLSAWEEAIFDRLCGAGGVLLALDFDGTLAPLAPRPEDAALPPETAGVLRALAATPGVELAIISGRALEDVRAKAGLDAIYAGNHGLEIEGQGIHFRHAQGEALRGAIEQACGALEERFESVPGVRVERKGLTATLHYRQAPGELETWIGATVRHALSPYSAYLRLRAGSKAWEIRPRVNWNKGAALRYLIEELGKKPHKHECLCHLAVLAAGDDLTDEDMFRAVPEGVTIRVETAEHTAARFHAGGPAEFAGFLARLRTALAQSRPEPAREVRCLPEERDRTLV